MKTLSAPPTVDGLATGSGCGKAAEAKGVFELSTTDSSGQARTYEVTVPENYDPNRKLALTFLFHAGNGNGRTAREYGIREAAGNATIIVAPDGLPFSNGTASWSAAWDTRCGGYDVGLFDRILAEMKERYCIDDDRVFAVGGSWGGDFVTSLACCRGDRIRAIASNAATDSFSDPKDFRSFSEFACPVASKAAIRFTHSQGGDSEYPAPYFQTTSDLYRYFAGCKADARPVADGQCQRYAGCARPYVECSYPGLGHALPKNFGNETWQFFERLKELSGQSR